MGLGWCQAEGGEFDSDDSDEGDEGSSASKEARETAALPPRRRPTP
jgi:hypothetical protein